MNWDGIFLSGCRSTQVTPKRKERIRRRAEGRDGGIVFTHFDGFVSRMRHHVPENGLVNERMLAWFIIEKIIKHQDHLGGREKKHVFFFFFRKG